MTTRPTPKGETSRQAVLQAAYQLFLERGYHATSIRDISRRCGLTTGGVYTHFKDKGEIFTAVLDQYHPFWQILPALSAAQGDTLEALVHDMARRMVAALGHERGALNLIFIETVEFQGQHFEEMFPTFFSQLAPIIQRFIAEENNLRPFSLPILVRSFFGLFFSYFMTSIILANRLLSDDQTLHDFVDIYLHGILAAPPQPTEADTNKSPTQLLPGNSDTDRNQVTNDHQNR